MPFLCTNAAGERGTLVQLRVTFLPGTSPVWKLSQVDLEYWEHFTEAPGMKEIQTCPSLSKVHARPSPSCQQGISSAALLLNTDRKPDHLHLLCLGFLYSIQKSAVCIFGIISYLISYRGYCYRIGQACSATVVLGQFSAAWCQFNVFAFCILRTKPGLCWLSLSQEWLNLFCLLLWLLLFQTHCLCVGNSEAFLKYSWAVLIFMYGLHDRLQNYAFLGKKLQLLFIATAFAADFYLTFKSFFWLLLA